MPTTTILVSSYLFITFNKHQGKHETEAPQKITFPFPLEEIMMIFQLHSSRTGVNSPSHDREKAIHKVLKHIVTIKMIRDYFQKLLTATRNFFTQQVIYQSRWLT